MRSPPSKTRPWSSVLYGLGIRHVGSVNAKTLTQHFPTVDELAAASPEDIEAVHTIGPEIAQSVAEWFQNSCQPNFGCTSAAGRATALCLP